MFQDFRFPHSADVRMWLDCGEHGRIDLSRVTPSSVVAKVVRDLPACEAYLVVVVDGEEMRTRVASYGFSNGKATVVAIDDNAPF
jgi:hypothetical protein